MLKVKGFTLVELIITIAVAAILLAIGAPSLNNLYQTIRTDMGSRKIQQVLTYARGQAITLRQNITVCHLTENRCDNSWGDGLTVFVDMNTNNELDGNDMDLRHIDSFHSSDNIKTGKTAVSFQADGLAFNSNTTITYCVKNYSSVSPKSVVISRSGRIKLKEEKASKCD